MNFLGGVVAVLVVAVVIALGVCAIGAVANRARWGKRYECEAPTLERPRFDADGLPVPRWPGPMEGADLAAVVECLRYEVAWLRREVEVAKESVAEMARNAMRGQ